MEGVSFEDDQEVAPVRPQPPTAPGITQIVVKWGFAKDEKSAELFLIVLAVIAFVATIGICIVFFVPKKISPPPPLPPPTTIRTT